MSASGVGDGPTQGWVRTTFDPAPLCIHCFEVPAAISLFCSVECQTECLRDCGAFNEELS